MTCIVGLQHSRGVVIGGDSAGIANLDVNVRADEKVFYSQGMLIGFAGSFRMGQLLRYKLRLPKRSKKDLFMRDDMEYLVTEFIDRVRLLFMENGATMNDEEGSLRSSGNFLVAYSGNLYTIDGDFQVAKQTCKYAAIGCGSAYALGSLFSTEGLGMKPSQRVEKALEASTMFSAGVRPPYVVEEMKK